MSANRGSTATDDRLYRHDERGGHREWEEEETTETRRSTATSELWVFVILAAAILFFTYESGRDTLSRVEGWRFVTWLAVGYLISRGLAKAGSYETFRRRRDND